MRRLALTCSVLSALILSGCSSATGPQSSNVSDGPISETREDIAFGMLDGSGHPAVVALLANAGGGSFTECSGSIVQVKGGQAYVLTAAHCCNMGAPTIVVAGNNYGGGAQALFGGPVSPPVYNVTAGSVYWDSAYNQQDHDFCMLKFPLSQNIAPLALPTSCSSDHVANGVAVDHVGFGVTDNNTNNEDRNIGSDSITSFTSTTISYTQGKQSNGTKISGPCEGDSGGPALWPAGAAQSQQMIVATTSFGLTQTCGADDTGTSSRVCSEIGSGKFITSFLNDTPIGNQPGGTSSGDCNTCQTDAQSGACASATSACGNDPACVTLSQCLGNCTDQTCIQQCANTAMQTAVNEYNAFVQCICQTACTSQCATECGGSSSSSSSSGGGNCGLQSSDATCNTCLDNSCCSEAQACAADSACVSCLSTANPPASCNSNQALIGLSNCLNTSCSTACGGGSSSSSSGTMSSSSGTMSSSSGTLSSSSGTLSSSSGTLSSSSGNAGTGGAGGNEGSGGGTTGQKSGCSVNGAGEAPASDGSIAGLLLGLALAVSRRRRSA